MCKYQLCTLLFSLDSELDIITIVGGSIGIFAVSLVSGFLVGFFLAYKCKENIQNYCQRKYVDFCTLAIPDVQSFYI